MVIVLWGIVGGLRLRHRRRGAAGCVLAYRLSEDPNCRVLLLEAGARDRNPLIHMPKGLAKVMADSSRLWVYQSDPEPANAQTPETWVRGRLLGGSSSVNGMMYVRGKPQDFDALAEIAGDDWSWRHIGPAYAALESQLGAGPDRGADGPLRITLPDARDPLTDAMIEAVLRCGRRETLPVRGEIVLAGGALASPGILERSGIDGYLRDARHSVRQHQRSTMAMAWRAADVIRRSG